MNKDMEYIDKYECLMHILTEKIVINGKETSLKDDFERFFVKGNKTAGTRIRKIMQILRRAAEDVRNDVQEYKKSL